MIEWGGCDSSGYWLFYGDYDSCNECWYLIPYSWELVE